MKKFAAMALIAFSALTLTGCEAATEDGNTEGFTSEVITVGGGKFDCTFENRGWRYGTMSCLDLQTPAIAGESDTEGFTREIITVRNKQLDCIFENRGWQYGTMSCFQLKS